MTRHITVSNGKTSQRKSFKYNNLRISFHVCCRSVVGFSYVAQRSERLRGVQAVRLQASVEPNYFSVVFVCLIFAFFLLLVCFSLILLLAFRLSFTRCCDIRISELFV